MAGFGSEEFFPTLVSFEIEGMVCDHLKYVRRNLVKINQEEQNAQVIPFAQKEMVERFLYGLDNDIESEIVNFCRKTVPNIRQEILKSVEFEDDDELIELEQAAEAAEEAFIDGLRKRAFDEIRSNSRAEIEDMVEFMPKPELAKMAEALVDLTSIKRRVSRGMETVGGPIDVAVISKSEGFVWIKRKHYFPKELNSRYFARLNRLSKETREPGNGKKSQAEQPSATRRRKAKITDGAARPAGSGSSDPGKDPQRLPEFKEG